MRAIKRNTQTGPSRDGRKNYSKNLISTTDQKINRSMSRWLTHLILTALTIFVFCSSAKANNGAATEIETEYLVQAMTMKTDLLRDYETLLRVYYSLKQKTTNPNSFPSANYNPSMANDPTIGPISRARFSEKNSDRLPEFSLAAYLELQAQLDRDPRLMGNSFLKRMLEYGARGQANDVFQRIGTYALVPYDSTLEPDRRMDLSRNIGNPVSALALLEAQEVFRNVSTKSGYPHNGAEVDPTRKTEWGNKVKAKAFELRKELRARGLTKSMRASKSQAAKAAAQCAQGFRSIAPEYQ